MAWFAFARLARAMITILVVVGFAFIVLRLSGDPALEILSNDAPPEARDAFRSAFGLDQPIWLQFFDYMTRVATGNLGNSMREGRDALSVVIERIPITLALSLPALLINVLIGIPAGILAALHRNSLLDRGVMLGAVAGFTIPSFVLGLLLVLVFSVQLGCLPSGGARSWHHAILPVLTLGAGGAAVLARYTRSAMLEVLGQPYIRTAHVKGVPWGLIVYRHALPNAAIPMVTIVGFMVGQLIAGAVLVESVFAWPGVGRLLVASVVSRDLPVVQCVLFLVALTMVTSNLVVDLLYGLLDPRIRRGGHA
ncbi:ABC transporter permease [Bradyrhizobium elkanii]|uniref:Peptide/nickel transport system permease protein n=1 Tax=Bradyrhizobium elkanii TaxID=29448 RepID=A0ABV4EU37_BRAEL|nr:ABC transporter permease [Bradyrhizobium elkanii]MCP1755685.1 peptide/nickel transport system permease protein [Bradyrhizobium elkanii]MCP1981201.1 peptide/nickel transport system permease protein [Bradyrhizobium elkanii]MCS3689423.1 peptide/nickel transport system permease protein [Bradyrhizobium elkanii]MCS3884020.1 peptide/nickel transport system permease protein [Bradyrhizobium elkanii]MCS4216951.1 peptide/nickel transport system permease protein [Bradyrhizobium elkanii]